METTTDDKGDIRIGSQQTDGHLNGASFQSSLHARKTRLADLGFIVCSPTDLNLPSTLHEFLLVKYFHARDNGRSLGSKTSQNIGNSLVYGRLDGEVEISAPATVATYQGDREGYSQICNKIEFQGDKFFERLVRGLLEHVPDESRRSAGTVSINLYDHGQLKPFVPTNYGADYVILYNVGNSGQPMHVDLSHDPDGLNIAFSCDLQEGELLILQGTQFFHSFAPGHDRFKSGASSEMILLAIDRMR